MKTNLILIFIFSTILVSEAQKKADIDFSSSSSSYVLQKAEEEKKPIFLYAYSPSCHFCQEMEKGVFTGDAVANFYNTRFINYKIDIEDGGKGNALAEKYAISSFPTYLYFNANGELMHQSNSAKPAEEFILDGKNALSPNKSLFSLKTRYDRGDRSLTLLYDYSNALASYDHKDSPEEQVVREYLETQSAQQLESEKNLKYIFTRHLSFNAPTTQYFLANQTKFAALFGEDEVKYKAEKTLTNTASLAGHEDDTSLFKQVERCITANFTDTSKLASLVKIHFYQGQGNWAKYAKATLKYGSGPGKNDWRTMHNTAHYLKYFAQEIPTLEAGVQLMEQVIDLEKSYARSLYTHSFSTV